MSLLSLADTALLISIMVWLLHRRGERARDVFFGGRGLVAEFGTGIALVPLVLVTVYAVLITLRTVAPWLHNVPDNPLEALASTPREFAILLVVVVVAGGVREELQRAFLLHRFKHDLGGGVVGLIVTSIAFGLGHGIQGWDATIVTGVLGAVWASMYLARGSAAAAMANHAVFNSLEVLRAFLTRAGG